MKTVFATICGLLFCFCSQAVAQLGFTGHENFYGGDCPDWEFRSAVLVMDLKDSNLNQPAVTDSNLGTVLLTSNQLSAMDTGVGIDASLFRITNAGQRWELRSTFASFNQSFQINGSLAGNMNDVFNPGFPPASVISFGGAGGSVRGNGDKENRLDFFGIELNAHRAVAPGLSFFVGPKFVNLDDQLSVFSSRVNGAFTVLTARDLSTSNRMFGGSTGFDLNLRIARNVSLNGFMRAGYYANDAKFDLTTASNLSPNVITTQTRQTLSTFMGEFGGSATWEICPNAVAVEAGYHAFWVDNAARAFSQAYNTGSGIGTETIFFHGLRLTLIYRR